MFSLRPVANIESRPQRWMRETEAARGVHLLRWLESIADGETALSIVLVAFKCLVAALIANREGSGMSTRVFKESMSWINVLQLSPHYLISLLGPWMYPPWRILTSGNAHEDNSGVSIADI